MATRKATNGYVSNSELANMVNVSTGVPKHDVQKVIRGMFECIEACAMNDCGVIIYGYGRFDIYDTEEYEGRDMFHGCNMMIPARRRIKFRPSRSFMLRLSSKLEKQQK